jgi:hypothetical protein
MYLQKGFIQKSVADVVVAAVKIFRSAAVLQDIFLKLASIRCGQAMNSVYKSCKNIV